MNEKIKQLAIEAGIDTTYLANTKQIVLLEKFAELIVQECYSECKTQLMDTSTEDYALAYNDGVMDCAIGLLNHFGVEP
jgi:hypothetical protein